MRRPREFGWAVRTQFCLGQDGDVASVGPHLGDGAILSIFDDGGSG